MWGQFETKYGNVNSIFLSTRNIKFKKYSERWETLYENPFYEHLISRQTDVFVQLVNERVKKNYNFTSILSCVPIRSKLLTKETKTATTRSIEDLLLVICCHHYDVIKEDNNDESIGRETSLRRGFLGFDSGFADQLHFGCNCMCHWT